MFTDFEAVCTDCGPFLNGGDEAVVLKHAILHAANRHPRNNEVRVVAHSIAQSESVMRAIYTVADARNAILREAGVQL